MNARALVLLASALSLVEPATLTVQLVNVGPSYALRSLDVSGQTVRTVLVDTGSSDLIVRSCAGRSPEEEGNATATPCFTPGNRSAATLDPGTCAALVEDGTDRVDFGTCMVDNDHDLALPATPKVAAARRPPFLVAGSMNLTNPRFHPWEAAGGLLGLAFPSLSQHADPQGRTAFEALLWNATTATVANAATSAYASSGGAGEYSSNGRLVGLDLREPPISMEAIDGDARAAAAAAAAVASASALHLGGLDPAYGNHVAWSEVATYGASAPAYHGLRLHHLGMCGQPLLAASLRETSSWPAVADTGSDCLALPSELFDAVAAWAPFAYCGTRRAPAPPPARGGNRHLCFVAPGQASALPWLSFTLAGNGLVAGATPPRAHSGGSSAAEGGRWVHLPLKSLLLTEADGDGLHTDRDGNLALCLERGEPALNVPAADDSATVSADDDGADDGSASGKGRKKGKKLKGGSGGGGGGGVFDGHPGGEGQYYLDDDAPGGASLDPTPAPAPLYVRPYPGIVLGSVALRALYLALDFGGDLNAGGAGSSVGGGAAALPRAGLASKWDSQAFGAARVPRPAAGGTGAKPTATPTATTPGATSASVVAAVGGRAFEQVFEQERLGGCAASVAPCGGQAVFDAAANACAGPDCAAYYLHARRDGAAGPECAAAWGCALLLGLACVVGLGLELATLALRQVLGRELAATAGRGAPPPPGEAAAVRQPSEAAAAARCPAGGCGGGVIAWLSCALGLSRAWDRAEAAAVAFVDKQIDEAVSARV